MARQYTGTAGYGYERVPLLGDEKDGGAFRIFDPADNRIATSYVEENAQRIVDALNTVAAVRSALTLIGGTINVTGPTFTPRIAADEITGLMQHRRGDRAAREPVADLGSVSVPTVDELLPRLLALSGEDAFRIFDRVHVLPGNREAVDGYNLTDPSSVRRMIAECCTVAVNLGKLGELAKAVDEHAARVGK